MEAKLQTSLVQSFLNSFEPPFNGEVYEWAHEYVDLPPNYAVQGKFDINLSKYLIEPIKDLRNQDVTQVNLIAATQTGKTMASELFLPYVIVNDGGPVLKLHQTDDMAKTFVETRLIPLLERCPPVKAMLDNKRFSATITGINLPHMSIKMGGAKENILHGLTIRYLLADEVWLWDKDSITKAKARTTAYGTQKKVLITSQPGVEGDGLWDEMTGKIFEWAWKCPCCGNFQPYYWSKETESGSWAGMVWDKKMLPDSSSYDYEGTAETARLQCYYCTGSLTDTEANRRYLNDTGKYILTRDNGNPQCHTYVWPAAVNMKIPFKQMVIQYLQAITTHRRIGTTDGLRIFTQQVLGHFWRRSQPIEASKVLATAFNPDEKWPDELFRCIAVDYQKKNEVKYYVVCSFSQREIRVLDHSFCHKWEDVAALQTKWGVPSAGVMVDSGYNSDEVYRECCSHSQPIVFNRKVVLYGWWALKGDGGHEYYNHKIGTDTARRYFSPEIKASINNAQFARLIQWANLPIKNMLFHIREGNSDIKLVLPTKDPNFDEHLNAESLEWIEDKTGVKAPRWIKHSDNNHWLDCMCMALVGASMRGIYTSDVIEKQNIINAMSGSLKK
jgi:phage terminase large subunit GpA-like protein